MYCRRCHSRRILRDLEALSWSLSQLSTSLPSVHKRIQPTPCESDHDRMVAEVMGFSDNGEGKYRPSLTQICGGDEYWY